MKNVYACARTSPTLRLVEIHLNWLFLFQKKLVHKKEKANSSDADNKWSVLHDNSCVNNLVVF